MNIGDKHSDSSSGISEQSAQPMGGRTFLAAMVIGSVTLLILGILPILLGALVDENRLAVDQLGRIATIEILALAVGSTLGPRFMDHEQVRMRAIIVAALLVGAHLLTIHAESVSQLALVRAAAGFCQGLLLASSILVITRAPDPERSYGLFYAVITIPQAIAGYILPAVIIPRFGADSGFLLLAGLAAFAIPFAMLLPKARTRTASSIGAVKPIWTPAVCIAIAAVVLHNAGTGAIWTYVDRVASSNGFDGETVGLAFGVSLAAQIAGGMLVAAIGTRLPFRQTLVFGMLATCMVVFGIYTSQTPVIFIALAAVFGLIWVGLLPFYTRLMVELDQTREIALLLFGVGIGGFSVGPFIASFVVSDQSVAGAVAVSIILYVAAAIAYHLAGRQIGCVPVTI